jgi:prephenate dehydrogenase
MSDTSDTSWKARSICIVGLGLIGGSIARALKQRGWTGKIHAHGRSIERLADAKELGLIDHYSSDIGEAVKDAELIIVCTPVDHIVHDVLEIARHCHHSAVITDVGSVKSAIYKVVHEHLPKHVTFVGGHPLAGSEKSGFENATPDLFEGRYAVLTPDEHTSSQAVQLVSGLWKSVGAVVTQINPVHHDEILARTSHLPHVVAFSLASVLTNDLIPYCAGGFKDTTRIAASDPDLWTAIFRMNKDEILGGIDEYLKHMQRLRHAIFHQDWQEVHSLIEHARKWREKLNHSSLPTRID